jgi:hypothetical protein
VTAPEVAMPPARLRVPGKAPTVPHIAGLVSGRSTVAMRNIVVPYISIRSPGRWAPTLTASVHASIVPVMTGVPAGMPARALVVVPATSPGHASGGSSISGATSEAHGRYQSRACVSNSGVHWLAEW